MVSWMIKHKIYRDESPSLKRGTYLCTLLVVKAGIEREREFNFAALFYTLHWSCHVLAATRSTIWKARDVISTDVIPTVCTQLNGYKYCYLIVNIFLILIICLHTVKWFQVLLFNISNSIYQVSCNMNNFHTAVWLQISRF